MKKLIFLVGIVLLNSSLLFSQIAINDNGSPPHPSAGLDVNFTDKGFLLPRMTYVQRNAIQNPAEGLMIYCTDCEADASGALSIFSGGLWRIFNLNCTAPNVPLTGIHIPSATQIIWNWNTVPIALGYKWNITNDYSSATDMFAVTSKTETGLTCDSSYTRYVWAYNECGQSPVMMMTQSTLQIPFSPAPTPFSQFAGPDYITWSWFSVPGATGYKWNTSNNPVTAIDLENALTYTESGLICQTAYTRYVWAYDQCGISTATTLSKSTTSFPPSSPVSGAHVPSVTQIIWNWNTVAGATGYKWNLTNNYATATDMSTATSKTETGLTCNSPYTRYVWAYSNCGVSTVTTLTQATSPDPPAAPVAAAHTPAPTQIIWNWGVVSGAAGYKWNTTNNYANATDMFTATSKTETGLTCNNVTYTRYVWAYGSCGVSSVTTLTQATLPAPPPAPVAAAHVPSPTQIIWKWNTVSGATSYRWNTDIDSLNAANIGNVTSWTETGLVCNTQQTSYVWAVGPCGVSTKTILTQSTTNDPPASPTSGTHVPYVTQIIWNWNTVAGATGYKWSTTNVYATATDMFTATSKTEAGLTCNSPYTRYVWAYGSCGVSAVTVLTQSTLLDPPSNPATATHGTSLTQIVWNWNPVAGATGYKWNTTNNYASAQDMLTATSKTEGGLTCNSPYTRYVWAYSNCGVSTATTLTQSTAFDAPANPGSGTHIASATQIIWNWIAVSGATGYKWSADNNYNTATDMGIVTTHTETGLDCADSYTRYVWAYGNCGYSIATTLTQSTPDESPAIPVAATHIATSTQIIWNWETTTGATGYKWNTENNYGTATDVGNNLSTTESGLLCNSSFTRYVWAYNNCGESASSVTLTQSTLNTPPPDPVAGTHFAALTQIDWNWNTVADATGYKWSIANDYNSATDLGTATSFTEDNLVCGTNYTRYVWAYNDCGQSSSVTLAQSTSACWSCGNILPIIHAAGDVAPVDKSVNYSTVTGIPGATSKCWITSNLGASRQAIAVNDATELSAGWYWQFNKKQGYKHDGTNRAPNTTWITFISEYVNWTTAEDPCANELGSGWRIPTKSEWENVSATWATWTPAWNSALKLHAAGRLGSSNGALSSQGVNGFYWSSIFSNGESGWRLTLASGSVAVASANKTYGFSLRCIHD